MHRDGLIELPPPRTVNSNGKCGAPRTLWGEPSEPVTKSVEQLE